MVKLRNLKSHWQIWIEIIFSIKRDNRLNVGIESLPKEDCLIYDFLAEKWECSRLSGTDRADMGVRWSVEVLFIFTAAKDFGFAIEFEVDFESDGDEVVGHFNEFGRSKKTEVNLKFVKLYI
ncbi:hypothetical protein FACS1894176_06890 [Bacteroidia bacterium]|nr:hypothetical protein FACS1894176_06890 [Bacteroidia bacterium]